MASTVTFFAKRYQYLLPAIPILIFFFAFFVYPSIAMIKLSFFKSLSYGEIDPTFTFKNYIKFFTDPFYLSVLFRSFVLGICVTAVTIPFGKDQLSPGISAIFVYMIGIVAGGLVVIDRIIGVENIGLSGKG